MCLLNNLKGIIHNLDFILCCSVASLIISFIATFFSYRKTRIAKQSLKLNEKLFEARTPRLEPNLRACFSYRLEKSQSKIYAFFISVSNLSDINNSISRLELQINYTRSNNLSNNLLLPHKPKLVEHLFQNSIKTLNVPIHIDAHQTIDGWTFFELDDSLIRNANIDAYKIRFIDSHGKESNLKPTILQEILNEETLAKFIHTNS
jgi:hypothetical protein